MALGRTVWHDDRSWNFPAETAPLQSVKYRMVAPLLDQSNVNACTSYAFANLFGTNALSLPMKDADALQLYGIGSIVDESTMDYWPRDDTGLSSLGACKGAERLGLITGYRWAFGIDHLLGALMLRPFVVGMPAYEGMKEPDDYGFIHADGEVIGGHAMAVIAVNMEKEYVVFANSWGTEWGFNGRARMTLPDVDKLLQNQGDCVTVLR